MRHNREQGTCQTVISHRVVVGSIVFMDFVLDAVPRKSGKLFLVLLEHF